MGSLLQTCQLTKHFPGVRALSEVDFDLRAGEVHALCGENGAGKSTLIKVLSGIHPHGSFQGDLLVDERQARFRGVRDAERAGIAVIHQELALVDDMTIAENVFLGREPTHRGWVNFDELYSRAAATFERLGIALPVTATVGSLGVGQQQLVEIAKALAKDSRILVLDEPSAALSEQEVEALLNIVRRLRASGKACVYISHRLDEVFAVADRITVLRDGRSITTSAAGETNAQEVIQRMVGRAVTEIFPSREVDKGAELLRADGLSVQFGGEARGALRDLSFSVRAGEVLGIGGLMGAGRTELLMHLYAGWGVRVAGSVLLCGERHEAKSPRCSLNRGMALVSEDRKRHGLVLEQSVGFNLSLSSLRELCRFSFIDQERESLNNRAMVQRLRIKAVSLEAETRTLSGGNQQKVVLGKVLQVSPKVILLDEPTRGIDVGAKAEIYQLIATLTRSGLAVLLVSSELTELVGLSDRIIMLSEGRVGGTFERGEASQEQLLRAAMVRAAKDDGSASPGN